MFSKELAQVEEMGRKRKWKRVSLRNQQLYIYGGNDLLQWGSDLKFEIINNLSNLCLRDNGGKAHVYKKLYAK